MKLMMMMKSSEAEASLHKSLGSLLQDSGLACANALLLDSDSQPVIVIASWLVWLSAHALGVHTIV